MAVCAECPHLDTEEVCSKPCGVDDPPQLDHPQLHDTGNGPNVSYEEDLLRQFYGEADANGVYGAGG